jgi:putative spermidine/putrescine transport system ATP-binding protein
VAASEGEGSRAVEIDAVSKRFAETWAMRNVSFAARKGEFVTLLGPSGCGKTTTLRVIAGFETPTEGDIRINGASVSRLPSWRRDFGVVFQSYALFPYMTAFHNIAFGLKMRRRPKDETRRRVEAALAMVGLAGYGERYPRQMSGGQRQRVALARALVIEPQLLLLDEPLSNLDARLRAEMRLELKRIQRESGVTTIFVTHDQEEAFSLSDRIVLMEAGRVRQIGAPRQVWTAPNSVFVADFIGVENLFAGQLSRKRGRAEVRLESGGILLPPDVADVPEGRVVVGIRARDVALAASGESDGTVEGRVVDADYRGHDCAYRIATGLRSDPITVVAPAERPVEQSVRLHLPAGRLMLLARDE